MSYVFNVLLERGNQVVIKNVIIKVQEAEDYELCIKRDDLIIFNRDFDVVVLVYLNHRGVD